jgi:hypothetical protein
MLKAVIFGVLIVALLVSSTPGFAKGGSNGTGKDFPKTSDHKSEPISAKTRKGFSEHASKPASNNAGGVGAGKRLGYTGNSPGAGAGRPPGYVGNSPGAGSGRPPGYTGNGAGAGAGKT